MDEIPKRLEPKSNVKREIMMFSGNECAFPGCRARMMDAERNFIGQLCHIELAEPGGPRFNAAKTNEERRCAANLMLMCYPHHQATNDTEKYPVDRLKAMKAAHEQRFLKPTPDIQEWLAHADKVALTIGGMTFGAGLSSILDRMRTLLDLGVRFAERAFESRGPTLRAPLCPGGEALLLVEAGGR